MNLNCFLLDGKTILPVDHNHQIISKNLNKNCPSCQKKFNENLKSNNKYEEENFCSHSLQSTEKYHEYLISRMIPSINLTIDSTSMNNNQSNKLSPSIMIIIKPLISSEKRKNSSISLQNSAKRIFTYKSEKTVINHRLSTFKDITRPIPTTRDSNQPIQSNILNSGTLLDIYRNKKLKRLKN